MKPLILIGDFETTVYDGQDDTQVWASAIVEMYTEDVHIFHSIGDTYTYLESLNRNVILYYHNLKFDGSFWLQYFMRERNFKQAFHGSLTDAANPPVWMENKEMPSESFKYSIASRGPWYTVTVKTASGNTIEMRDSLKLLPFSVKRIGKSFDTKHKKLDMEYKGYRYPGCVITEEEQGYIANDVLVVKEALEYMYSERHKSLTIGSCCLKEYKSRYTQSLWEEKFPDLTQIPTPDPDKWKAGNWDEYIRKAYKGGWCYLVPGKASKVYSKGITADVNSLYPSVMSGESGNLYPVGQPIPFTGEIPPQMRKWRESGFFWYVRIRTRFYIKEGMLPTIQIKGNRNYGSTEWLDTSDVYNRRLDKFCRYYYDPDGVKHPAIVELTLSCVDYDLFLEHYNVEDFELLDGVGFHAESGLFDDYMEKYKKIKMESKGAKRELAKLFLNNLYGKMAASNDSSFKIARINPKTGGLCYIAVEAHDKKPGYIPVGAAITSYARDFTIRHAQKNFYGEDNPGFIYADTDSIHCDLSAGDLVDIRVHPTQFLCWKLESTWDTGYFVRQKTYIEHVVESDLEPCEPFYSVRCAGMSEHCKQLFVQSITEGFNVNSLTDDEKSKYTEKELAFLSVRRIVSDFDTGLTIPGQLKARSITGGTLLKEQDYRMIPQRKWGKYNAHE